MPALLQTGESPPFAGVSDYRGANPHRRPTAAYLSAKGRRLDPLVRRYLESLLTAPLTFFEVLACDPGIGMTLRGIMTQEEHAVTERGLSENMQPGDLLFGQLAFVDQLTMIEAFNGFVIPPLEKATVIALRAGIAASCPVITQQVLREWDFELLDLFHDIADRLYNPQPPILQNTDGEPILLSMLVFELKAPLQTAFDALKHLALEELREDLRENATRDSGGRFDGRPVLLEQARQQKARRMGQHHTRLDRDRRRASHGRGQLRGARR